MLSRKFNIAARLHDPQTHLFAFLAFLVLVAVLGGGSRDDILSLAILRPVAALFLGWGLFFADWRVLLRRAPLIGLLLLALLMAMQLVPLPYAMWSSMPGRQLIADIDANMGLGQIARPLTLSPFKTTNALFSLLVPAAALVLLSNVRREDYAKVVTAVIVMALASAAFGLAQLAGPPQGSLYTYRITNFGEPVGFFSNRNHQAVLLAVAIVLIGWFAGQKSRGPRGQGTRLLLPLFSVPILILLNLVGGSRLGLALSVLAFIPAGLYAMRNDAIQSLFVAQDMGARGKRRSKQPRRRLRLSRGQMWIAAGAIAIAIVGLAVFVSNSASLDRFLETDTDDEMRAQLLPVFIDMAKHYFPWGAGFGSFEHIYPIFEPIEKIERRYLNQAHNDLMQFLIEGGLPAALLLLAGLGWLLWRTVSLVRAKGIWGLLDGYGLLSLAVVTMYLGASLFDYPLRAPISMVVIATFLFLLDRSGRADRTDTVRENTSRQRRSEDNISAAPL